MIRIIQGHALEALAKLPDNSVHCCITSPPYWKVRSFGSPPQVWGGDPNCEHEFVLQNHNTETYTLAYRPPGERSTEQYGVCTKCQALYGSLGSESTPELYAFNLSLVFNEVRRVLRPDGTLWLNIGDRRAVADKHNKELKPKDLIGLPWLTAFMLRGTGWYLRSAIILAKRAPIPEAGVDRPVTSYDHLFLLTKSPKYYYDGHSVGDSDINFNVKDVWTIDHEYTSSLQHFGTFPKELPRRCILLGTPTKVCGKCWAPYNRVFNTTKVQTTNRHIRLPKTRTKPTKDWIPSCQCNVSEQASAIVLDPFAGTMTTSLVAQLLLRDSVSIELSPEWIKTGKHRLYRDGGLMISIQEDKTNEDRTPDGSVGSVTRTEISLAG